MILQNYLLFLFIILKVKNCILHESNDKQNCKTFVNELKKTLVDAALWASLSALFSSTPPTQCRFDSVNASAAFEDHIKRFQIA